MLSEVAILVLISLFGLVLIILFLFSPSFTKKLIGENDPYERKIFKNNLPFWEFLVLTLFLPLSLIILVLLFFKINQRDSVELLPIGEKMILWANFLNVSFMAYGEGVHAASVSIEHYMKELKQTRAYQAVSFYHHLLSHFLSILGVIFLLLTLTLYEINHPYIQGISTFEFISLLIGGIILGIVIGFVIIEGRGKYYSIPALSLSLMVLLFFLYDLELNFRELPLMVYVNSTFASSLLTLIFWRIRKGELQETIGEFFHEIDSD